MNISFLGGAREVGGSCILVKIYNKNILMDCGIRQSSSKDALPDFKSIQEQGGIDAIIISHSHMDHIGSLPIISKEYPLARIYTTKMTKDLMKVLLYDSLKIMNNREGEIPLYAEVDVKNMLDSVFIINYMVEFPIFQDIKITFYMAGHIAGAACVYITTPEGSLFYSGDFSIFSQKTVDGLKVPKLRPDVAIFEATYGDRLHSNREVEEERLIDIINECNQKKGKMLIPAFALGRSQEVLLTIKKALNKNILKNIKVYVDGMIRNINRTYKLNPLYLKNSLGKKILKGIEPFYDDNIIPVDNNKLREKILEDKESVVIVSSSGMLTGGYSQYYAEKIAPMENGYIVMTGYQDEESPGRKLLDLLKEEKDKKLYINEKVVPVKCKVKNIGLSAHSDKNEIKSLINFLNPKNIFIVHGNEEVIKSFCVQLSSEVKGKVYAPRCSEIYDINVNKPRKQWKKSLNKIMNCDRDLNENNLEELWKFMLFNYGEKLFTLEEMFYIWNGHSRRRTVSDNFEKIVIKSPYFENDTRRLFLFKCKSVEQVEESLKIRELKPNELKELTNKYFKYFNPKKSSFMYDEKKVVLSFDFPSTVNKNINNKIKQFEKETDWKVEISDTININAASEIINNILNDIPIKKISYRLEQKQAIVITDSKYNIQEHKLKEFEDSTGLCLLIQSPEGKIKDKMENIYIETSGICEAMEQNKALNLIGEFFSKEEFKPYRKSIKAYNDGKCIELSFISPVIGEKYRNHIQDLANVTGWNISVSSSANQNEIIKIALDICKKNNIKLKKNPSFNNVNLSLELKLEDLNVKGLDSIKSEFEHKTGCTLKW